MLILNTCKAANQGADNMCGPDHLYAACRGADTI